MRIFCSNCDIDATVQLTIHDQQDTRIILLCATCKDAYDWGTAHVQDQLTVAEEELNA